MFACLAHQSSMQELDFLNPVIDPRITYSGGPKMFFGSDGLMRDSTANYLLYSNDFTNAAWTKQSATVVADAIAGPGIVGLMDAVVDTAATGYHGVWQQGPAADANTYTRSVIVKRGTARYVALAANSAPNGVVFSWVFDFDTGTFTYTGTGSLGQSAVPLGSNAFRLSFTIAATSASTSRIYVGPSSGPDRADATYTGSGALTVYVAKAQYERGTFANTYVDTTSAAAYTWPLEYDPITLKPIGRSVWEQRSNLVARSQELGTYTILQATIGTNVRAAADGTTTADSLILQTSGTFALADAQTTSGLTAGSAYTFSVFVEAGPGFNNVAIAIGASRLYAVFDLVAGTVLFAKANNTNFNTPSAKIERVSANIWRCSVTGNCLVTQTYAPRIALSDGSDHYAPNVVGTPGVSCLYFWGLQLEAGAFASPYIPTAGSQVTRVADDLTFNLAGIRFNLSGMTVAATARAATGAAADQVIVQIDGNTDSQRWLLYRKFAGPGAAGAVMRSAGNPGDVTGPLISGDARYKVAAAFETDNLRISANGSASGQDVTAGMPTGLVTGRIGRTASGAARPNAPIERIAFYPCPVANSELQALTA